MVSYDTNARIGEIQKTINSLKEDVDQLLKIVKPGDDLWDNSDIIRYWKISRRTLVDWRKKGLISYVRIQNKIWYPLEARENFLKCHLIRVKRNNGSARS